MFLNFADQSNISWEGFIIFAFFHWLRKAKLLLKKKRYQEQVLTKTDNQLESLERLVQEIEFAQIEVQVVEGLKNGNDCLKKMHQVCL